MTAGRADRFVWTAGDLEQLDPEDLDALYEAAVEEALELRRLDDSEWWGWE